jgi:DNA-directed RNA polymerase subunit RPC12/RpoP
MRKKTSAEPGCPICGAGLVFPERGRYLRCPSCGTELVLGFEHYPVYLLVCCAFATVCAKLQGGSGPIFFIVFLVCAVLFLFIGSRTILPFLPRKISRNKRHDTLRLGL